MLSDTPTPPGETVEEEIEYIGMSKKQLADETGIPLQVIDEIFRGEMPITYDIADVFEQTLAFPHHFWSVWKRGTNALCHRNSKAKTLRQCANRTLSSHVLHQRRSRPNIGSQPTLIHRQLAKVALHLNAVPELVGLTEERAEAN